MDSEMRAPPVMEDMPMDSGDVEPDGNTDRVPIHTLGMPDDQDKMTPPEVGDEVTYTVTGKVMSISGDIAVIERMSINGTNIDDNDGDTEPATEDGLRNDAEAMDAAAKY